MELTKKTTMGGSNRVDIFEISAAGVVLTTGTGTTGGNATTGALITFDRTESSSFKGHYKKRNLLLTLASKINNANLDTFFKTYLSSETADDVVLEYEDGNKTSTKAVASNTPRFAFVDYSAITPDIQRECTYGIGVLSGATGDKSRAAKTLGEIPIEITAIENMATASVVFGTKCFDSTLVSGPVSMTIAPIGFAASTFLTAL